MKIIWREKKYITYALSLGIVFLVTLAMALSATALYFFIDSKYANKVFPGVSIANIDVGGMTYEEVELTVESALNGLYKNGLAVVLNNSEKENNAFEVLSLRPVFSFSPDSAVEIIQFDIDSAINQAMLAGRENDVFGNILKRFNLYSKKMNINVSINVMEKEIERVLRDRFGKFENKAQSSELEARKENGKIEFVATDDKNGMVIDYNLAIENIRKRLNNFDFTPVKLSYSVDYPAVSHNDALKMAQVANILLNKAPFEVIASSAKKTIKTNITPDVLAEWLSVSNNDAAAVSVDLNDKVAVYINSNIAQQIDIKAVDARLVINDGRVSEFIARQDGYVVDIDATVVALKNFLLDFENKNAEVFAVMKVAEGMGSEDVNELGVVELLGEGRSNFAGSPANRRVNIRIGANTLNGLLVAPGQEFSLVGALGAIDAVAGYLPELVIKGGKTVPEFGGGLCQIGTTLFRTVVGSGLPVTMRVNHSYRVGYYEPAGTDATIYDPWPDFKFINDTEKYVLIQTRIEGDDLRFEFWGTKDGRVASSTDPVIYNIKMPPPTKLIKTTDLDPGVKKCTEKAHSGADAYFDYSVLYADGRLEQKRFQSHYVPWQEVCLVGVDLDVQNAEGVSSSTPETVVN